MEYIDDNFQPEIFGMDKEEIYRKFNDNNVKNEFTNLVDIFSNTV